MGRLLEPLWLIPTLQRLDGRIDDRIPSHLESLEEGVQIGESGVRRVIEQQVVELGAAIELVQTVNRVPDRAGVLVELSGIHVAPHQDRPIPQLALANARPRILDDFGHELVKLRRPPIAERKSLDLDLIQNLFRVEIRHGILAHVGLVFGLLPVALPFVRVAPDQIGHEDARSVHVLADVRDQPSEVVVRQMGQRAVRGKVDIVGIVLGDLLQAFGKIAGDELHFRIPLVDPVALRDHSLAHIQTLVVAQDVAGQHVHLA